MGPVPPITPLITAPDVFTENGLKPGKKRTVLGAAAGAAGAGACADVRCSVPTTAVRQQSRMLQDISSIHLSLLVLSRG